MLEYRCYEHHSAKFALCKWANTTQLPVPALYCVCVCVTVQDEPARSSIGGVALHGEAAWSEAATRGAASPSPA